MPASMIANVAALTHAQQFPPSACKICNEIRHSELHDLALGLSDAPKTHKLMFGNSYEMLILNHWFFSGTTLLTNGVTTNIIWKYLPGVGFILKL